jgi:hypothetical protein
MYPGGIMKKSIICVIATLIIVLYAVAVMADNDYGDLLSQYESGARDFEVAEIGDLIVFWHERTIDGAIVEKDYIVYQFDKFSRALRDKKRGASGTCGDIYLAG